MFGLLKPDVLEKYMRPGVGVFELVLATRGRGFTLRPAFTGLHSAGQSWKVLSVRSVMTQRCAVQVLQG